ncbi:Crp/Fnr family transcriptional regulator [Salinarimonas ramus]|uniref:Cyclic nucleotide-binding protein n=1 Tax=Salinarimonas ramus TaxID=690164 RepID=A0A917V5C2_9HYPH|nr:Crp/Fnr family transcriptional regulator [Salinarimonas ramus]GGK39647.1 cyclic nucleotide-binding protein [Salinarimonas ramus]
MGEHADPIEGGTTEPTGIGSRILASLPPAARAMILRDAQRYPLDAGEVVYEAGDRLTHSVFIESGVVSEVTVLADGRLVESSTIGNESKIGASSLLMSQVAARTYLVRVAGTALFVPIQTVDAAVRTDFEARNVYMKLGQAMLNASLQSTACVAVHSAEQRAARWLLQAHDRVGDDFALKQSTLAEALCVRRATVSEICSGFAADGAIAYRRGAMHVQDRYRLRRFSCECYDVITKGFDAAVGDAPTPAVTSDPPA